MRRLALCCISIAIALTALFSDVALAAEAPFYYVDNDYNCQFDAAADTTLHSKVRKSGYNYALPAGFGIPSDFLASQQSEAGIPVRAIAEVSVQEPRKVIDMRNSILPPLYYSVTDAQGNSLIAAEKGSFVSSRYIRAVEGGWALLPPDLSNGSVLLPFSVGGVQTDVQVAYTFDGMTIFNKLDYSYLRGWITGDQFLLLVETARKDPASLPAKYRASALGVSVFSDSSQKLGAVPGLDSYASYDTADGKIRVYAYDRCKPHAMAEGNARTLRDAFEKYSVRERVLKSVGVTSLPQENGGKTIVFFNTSLSGGITVPNGDGTYHIEVGKDPGQFVLVHEYMHVVQQNKFGMAYTQAFGWWMEGTAGWSGLVLGHNDHYLSRLGAIQSAPWEAYDSGNLSDTGSRTYGTAALALFLEARNKNLISRSYAKSAQYTNMRDAINAALDGRLASEFAQYALRMYKPSKQMTSIVSYASAWPDAFYVPAAIAKGTSQTVARIGPALGNLGVEYVRLQTDANAVTIYTQPQPGVQYWLLMRGVRDKSWTYERITADNAYVSGVNREVRELVIAVINTSGAACMDNTITVKAG